MVSGYAYRGFISPLDEYFTAAEKVKFTPALVKSGTYDGKFYAPPLKNSCHVLWYNKKLLDKAGIPYPSADPKNRMTWEQVVELSQKIMAASGDPTVYGLTFEQISRPYQILPLVNSLGGEGIGPDGITVDGYVNGPAFVKAMQWYSDIHNKYKISPKGIAPSETVGQFAAGKIAFLSANLFDYKTFEKTPGLQYGYCPLPYFKEGKPVSPTDSIHVSVSNYSKNKDLAAEFVKYLTLGEGNDIYLDKQGEFSARIDVLNSYNSDAKYNNFPLSVFRLAALEAKTTAFPRPLSLGYREWESVMTATMEDIRNGADVKQALDKAVKTLNAQLQIYR
jgi:ABC-type glycerol-3-phosphate transport system substrate-binding protein